MNSAARRIRTMRLLAGAVATGATLACVPLRAQTWQLDPKVAPAILSDNFDVTLPNLAVRPYPNGQFLVTGNFNHIDNAPSPRIARLNRDLTIDRTFSGEVAANETVLSAAPLASGGVLVVIAQRGFPGNPNGPESSLFVDYMIFRLRADGRKDSSYPPLDIRFPARFAALPDGRSIAYGDFTSVGGTFRRGLARFTVDGSLDLNFMPPISGSASSSVLPGPNGTLFVSDLRNAPYFVRLRPDDSLDPTFTPAVRATQLSVAAQADGSVILLVGNKLMRIRNDGSVDPGYAQQPALASVRQAIALRDGRLAVLASTTFRGARVIYGPIHVLTSSGEIEREIASPDQNTEYEFIMDVLPDDRLLVAEGTRVTTVQGGPFTAGRLPRLVPSDGRAVTAFPPAIASRSAAIVRGVAIDGHGRALIHGDFTHVAGQPRPGLARLLPDGSVDPSFAPEGFNHVMMMALPDGGAIVSRNSIVSAGSENTLTYGSQVVRLRADGQVEPGFAFGAPLFLNETTWHLAAPDGRLLIQNTSLRWLAADGQELARLPTVFDGIPGAPRPTLRLTAEGRLLAGGTFTGVNGAPRPYLVRLHDNGTVDATYQPDLSSLVNIETATPLSDGRAVVFGHVWINGVLTPRAIRLRPDGAVERDYQLPVRSSGGVLLPDGSFVNRQRRFRPDGLLDLNYATELWSGNGAGTIEAATTGPDGSLWIGGRFDEISPQRRLALARYLPVEVRGITVAPRDTTVAVGGTTQLAVATGTTQAATYQWTHNGSALPGATRANLEFADTQAAHAGVYRAIVTLGGQTETSAPATLTVAPNSARLVNLSARSKVEPEAPQIAGFVCGASLLPRTVLLRAVGFGFPGSAAIPMLPVPVLSLQEGDRLLGTDRGSVNSSLIAELARAVGAFPISNEPLNPTWIRGSALAPSLGAGVYTAVTTTGNGNSGLSVFEFYDTGAATAPPLARNLSIRGQTSPGVNVLTAGFVIAGNGPLRVLVRGIGPSLAAFGVSNALPDPVLRVHASGVTLPLATNAAWAGDAALAAAAASAGAFPLAAGSRDAALVLTLEPGAYTVQLSGAGDSTGIALVELYALGP